MFYLGVAVDFDGTIARNGRVDASTLAALDRIRASGRRIVLVTGRRLADLAATFPEYGLFDRLVVENGAVLHDPHEDRTEALSPPPDPRLVELLRGQAQAPVEVGRSIVAGWEPDQAVFLEAVRQLGLELNIIFNKGALMLLPTGVNKASGLRAAARELNLRTSAFVGIGDAENDHSFLSTCGCACAVSNAVDSLKAEVDIIAPEDHGTGVEWVLERLLRLDERLLQTDRHGLAVGTGENGAVLHLRPHGNALVVGPSGTGKSALAAYLCEAALQRDLGFSVIDPEGDYPRLAGATVLDFDRSGVDVIDYQTLLRSQINPVLMLRGVGAQRRTQVIEAAIKGAFAGHAESGHPVYLLVDEAHQGLGGSMRLSLAGGPCVVMLTLFPRLLPVEVLRTVRTVIAFGRGAPDLLAEFCALCGMAAPPTAWNPDAARALMWRSGESAGGLVPYPPQRRHIRHAGKYATGDVGRERSFYFRGPDNRYLVAARNLFEFITVARQLPPEVWSHHLGNGDVGRWFRHVIGDDKLVELADTLARAPDCADFESLDLLSRLIGDRYCLPTEPPAGTP